MSTESLKTSIQKADESPKSFPAMLEKYKGEIARALPQHMNADRMARIALTAFRQNPGLANCDPRSVFGAVVQSSQLGLEIGLMGEAFLVPFSKSVKDGAGNWIKVSEAQLIPGYTGLIKLARNSGLVKDIYAHEVRQKDKFQIVQGLDRSLVHEPLSKDGFPADEDERGPLTGFYAVAVFKDGTTSFITMSVKKVNSIRDKSQGYIAACAAAKKYNKANSSPWVTDYEAMGLKTVIRALCKWMPKSPELAAAVALEDANANGQRQQNDPKEIIEGTWTVTDAAQDAADEQPPQETDAPTTAEREGSVALLPEQRERNASSRTSSDEPPPGAGRDMSAPRKAKQASMGLE